MKSSILHRRVNPVKPKTVHGARKAPQKRLHSNSRAVCKKCESMILSKKMKSFSKKCLTILLHLV